MIRGCVLLGTDSWKFTEACFMAYYMINFYRCFICAFKKVHIFKFVVTCRTCNVIYYCSLQIYIPAHCFSLSNLSITERRTLRFPTMMATLSISLGQSSLAAYIFALCSQPRLVRPKNVVEVKKMIASAFQILLGCFKRKERDMLQLS